MILGIDTSHYSPPVDWVKAKAGGVQFMYSKATEGLYNKDFMLKTHVLAAQKAGVLAGAYHFFHASVSGGQQADHFLNSILSLKLELPPVFDWETGSADGVVADEQMLRAKGWLSTVHAETGRTPMIYGGEAFLRDLHLLPEFARYPLWLAHYGVGETHVKAPRPWDKYTMWQYTDAESVAGLSHGHHVDASWFKGTIQELKLL